MSLWYVRAQRTYTIPIMDELAVAIPCTTAIFFKHLPYISPCYIPYIRTNNNYYKQDILSFLSGIIFSRLPHPHLLLYILYISVLMLRVYKYIYPNQKRRILQCIYLHKHPHTQTLQSVSLSTSFY